jgi:hypothetical protein
MRKKFTLTLGDEFIQYCELNNINDVEKLAKEIFNKGFTILKYGDKPIIKNEPTPTPIPTETPTPTITPTNTPESIIEDIIDIIDTPTPTPTVTSTPTLTPTPTPTINRVRDLYSE